MWAHSFSGKGLTVYFDRNRKREDNSGSSVSFCLLNILCHQKTDRPNKTMGVRPGEQRLPGGWHPSGQRSAGLSPLTGFPCILVLFLAELWLLPLLPSRDCPPLFAHTRFVACKSSLVSFIPSLSPHSSVPEATSFCNLLEVIHHVGVLNGKRNVLGSYLLPNQPQTLS